MLVDAGLTPFEALVAATTTPARLMAKQAEVGLLREGHRADLVLLDADPLVDIAAVRQLRGVMLRGEWLSREDLDKLPLQATPEDIP